MQGLGVGLFELDRLTGSGEVIKELFERRVFMILASEFMIIGKLFS